MPRGEERVRAEAGEGRPEVERDPPARDELGDAALESRQETGRRPFPRDLEEPPDAGVGEGAWGRDEAAPGKARHASAMRGDPDRPVRRLEDVVHPARREASRRAEELGATLAEADEPSFLAAEPDAPVARREDGADEVRDLLAGHVDAGERPPVEAGRAVLRPDPQEPADVEGDGVDGRLRQAVPLGPGPHRGAREGEGVDLPAARRARRQRRQRQGRRESGTHLARIYRGPARSGMTPVTGGARPAGASRPRRRTERSGRGGRSAPPAPSASSR